MTLRQCAAAGDPVSSDRAEVSSFEDERVGGVPYYLDVKVNVPIDPVWRKPRTFLGRSDG